MTLSYSNAQNSDESDEKSATEVQIVAPDVKKEDSCASNNYLQIGTNDPASFIPHEPRMEPSSTFAPTSTSKNLLQMFSDTVQHNVAPPWDDEKYLDNNEFHYTSSFQARPQAEYFDFDDRYKYYSDEEDTQELDSSQKPQQEPNEENWEQLNVQEGDHGFQDIVEDCETDVEEDYIDDMMGKVSICKKFMHDMIDRIDEAALSPISFKSTDMGPPEISKELADLLALVNHNNILLPLIIQKEDKTNAAADNCPSSTLSSSTIASSKINSLLRDDPCVNLPNFGVVLIKSPASIVQLWDEYTKIPSEWPVTDLFAFTLQQQGISKNAAKVQQIAKRKTSIQSLEKHLGSSWRNYDKNFSRQINRRKKIWKAIEEGLQDGLPLQECFSILENYVRDRGKGLSWYYNGVPFRLAEMSTTRRAK